jgi:hypothetical protein
VRFLADGNFLCWLLLAAFCVDLLSFTKLQQKFCATAAGTERSSHFAIHKMRPQSIGGEWHAANPGCPSRAERTAY